jgi:hypothetical protein
VHPELASADVHTQNRASSHYIELLFADAMALAAVEPNASCIAAISTCSLIIEFTPAHAEPLLANPEYYDYIMDYLHSRFGEQFFINQAAATAAAGRIVGAS